MQREAVLAYVAGLVDGEGSIIIEKIKWASKSNSGYQYGTRLHVSNSARELVDFCRAAFDCGHIYEYNGRPNHRPEYQWVVQSKIAGTILLELLPYLVLKKRQAIIAIALEHRKRHHRNFIPASPEEQAARARMRDTVTKLNH